MLKIRIGISELKKGDGDETVKDLIEYLEERLLVDVTTTGDEIVLDYEDENKFKKSYLRLLLRKFLHKNMLKEWFRVIAGKELIFIIKEKRRASNE